VAGREFVCPKCGTVVYAYRNPIPTVDIIINCPIGQAQRGVVLIKRRNPPLGWALPGGFIDYGESAEEAAKREALEETGLEVELLDQFKVYSRPDRDPRQHTLSVVFLAKSEDQPKAGDDAAEARIFEPDRLPEQLCFDHAEILADYFNQRKSNQPQAG